MSMTCDDRGNLDWKSLVSLVTEQFITLRHPSGGGREAAETHNLYDDINQTEQSWLGLKTHHRWQTKTMKDPCHQE